MARTVPRTASLSFTVLCVVLVAAVAVGTAAACTSKPPTGGASDQDAMLRCSLEPNVSHVRMTCDADSMLEGVEYELVTNTSCNDVQRFALTGAPSQCGFTQTFRRPSTCGNHGSDAGADTGVTTIDVRFEAWVVQHGGTIELDAGISGKIPVARRNTSTTKATAAWLLQVAETISSLTTVIPPHFVSVVQAFTVGRTYSILVYFTSPTPTIHATVDGALLKWGDAVCPEETAPVCFKSATFTPVDTCTAEEVSDGVQDFKLSLAARAECGQADADAIACVLGATDTTYATRIIQVPCAVPAPDPIVADISTVFTLDPVVSSDRLVTGSIILRDVAGSVYAFFVSHLQALVYPQVPQRTPQETVLAMTPQVFELIVDGKKTAHADAFGGVLSNSGVPKTKEELRLSLPLHADSYGISAHLGMKVLVELQGSVSFAQRRLLVSGAQEEADPRALLEERKSAPLASIIEVGHGYVANVCSGSHCAETKTTTTGCAGVKCVPIWALVGAACVVGVLVVGGVAVGYKKGVCRRSERRFDMAAAHAVGAV